MTTGVAPAVVIGVGNVLLGDDGVGIRVVEALGAASATSPGRLPVATRLVDGGTVGLDLLRAVDGARSLVLVDAVDLGAAPGTVRVLRGDAISAAGGCGPAGAVGELLAIGRLMGWLPDAVSLVGVQVATVGARNGLSAAVGNAVPVAVEAVCREVRELDSPGDPAWAGIAAGESVKGATA